MKQMKAVYVALGTILGFSVAFMVHRLTGSWTFAWAPIVMMVGAVGGVIASRLLELEEACSGK